MSSRDWRGFDVAIVGIGNTEQGEIPGRSANEIAVQAVSLALADAAIDKSEVDGLITCRVNATRTGIDTQIGALLGINPSYSATLDYGTCNFSLHLGVMAIAAGLATTVVLAYGANQRSARADFTMTANATDLGPASGYLHIAGPAAMALRRHQALYGTTEEQFGWIAVGQRDWARMNPLAIFRDELTMPDYLASKYLVEPLRRADVTMISDGGVAVVLTRSDRVSAHPKRPVYVIGMSEATELHQTFEALMRPMMGRAAQQLYAQTGLSPSDVDVFYQQDPTAVWVLQALEWYGFCPIGEAGPFLAEGHTRPGGSLPTNTNGGQLSESYMWGWLHLVEAVRQLRGECGERQVSAETALYTSTLGFTKAAASLLATSRP